MDCPRTVYAIKHNPTGKVYVGSTSHFWKRITTHMLNLRANRHPVAEMQNDFNIFGDDYTVFVLDFIKSNEDSRKEYLWMDLLDSRNPNHGYNAKDPSARFDLDSLVGITIPRKFGPRKRHRRPSPKLGFAKNLMIIRADQKFSKKELASALGVKEYKISCWENGITVPDSETIGRIADIFECYTSDLTDVGNEIPTDLPDGE